MEIMALLETIEDILERSFTMPVWGKTLVEKDDVLDIVKEIRLKLPDEIKQAKWVKEERHRILHEAQKEAEGILTEAEERIVLMADHHEKADEIIKNAQQGAREVQLGSREYADDVLAKLEDVLKDAIQTINNNRQELK